MKGARRHVLGANSLPSLQGIRGPARPYASSALRLLLTTTLRCHYTAEKPEVCVCFILHTSLSHSARAQCHGSTHAGGEYTATWELGVTSAPRPPLRARSRGRVHSVVGRRCFHSGTRCRSSLTALTSTSSETRRKYCQLSRPRSVPRES